MTDGASDGEEEELTFNVEKITEHKGVRPRKFLVHWEGYPPEEATWETEASLGDNTVLAAYLAALPAEQQKVSQHICRRPT